MEKKGKYTNLPPHPFSPRKKEIPQQDIYVPSITEECAPKQMVLQRLMFCWFSLETYFEKVKKTGDFEINSILAEIQTPTLKAKSSFTKLIPIFFLFLFLNILFTGYRGICICFFPIIRRVVEEYWIHHYFDDTVKIPDSHFQVPRVPSKCYNQVSLRIHSFLLNTAMPIGISEANRI